MTEKFPDLQNGQVALLRADTITGNVLHENFNITININQRVFSIFNNLNEAVDFAKSIIGNSKDIECNLYGKEMKIIQCITHDDL